jgi:Spy/CpxP family protein refolding chaperone
MKRTLSLAALGLALLAATAAQTATAQSADTTITANRTLEMLDLSLNLTSTQRSEIQQILLTEESTIVSIDTQLYAEHQELLALTTYDEEATLAILTKYAKANTDAVLEREKVRDEILAVLTPTQLQTVAKLHSEFSSALVDLLQTIGASL